MVAGLIDISITVTMEMAIESLGEMKVDDVDRGWMMFQGTTMMEVYS